MAHVGRHPGPYIPKRGPSWTLWLWLAFAIAFVLLTVIGFFMAGSPGG